jgi:hypothetical protein
MSDSPAPWEMRHCLGGLAGDQINEAVSGYWRLL